MSEAKTERSESAPQGATSQGSDSQGVGSGRSGALLVGAGILLSRLFGLVRERVLAHYLGNSAAADAFRAALRIPNVLQNLFGEGVLSGSFIPVYANLLGQQRRREADELAAAVFSALLLVVSALVALGVLFASTLVDVIAPGFAGEKRELTIALTRILFPATGVLVFSAWCLGILNSHRRFFLSYAAPVLWNLAIIFALLWFADGQEQDQIARIASWGVVAGSVAQFLIQLPAVWGCFTSLQLRVRLRGAEFLEVVRNFIPVVMGRGVVQISAYVDSLLASLLPTGAVAALSYMQTIYLIPVALFGMSVSAAELPALAMLHGDSARSLDESSHKTILERLVRAYRQVAFLIIPSAIAFALLGDMLIGALLQTGRFQAADTRYVWQVLIAASVGLFAVTLSRVFSSTLYALREPKIPFRCSLVRVAIATLLGATFALWVPGRFGFDPKFGLVGLVFGSALGGVVEYYLLKRAVETRLGAVSVASRDLLKLWLLAIGAGVIARSVATLEFPVDFSVHIAARAGLASVVFGLVYLCGATLLRFPEATRLTKRVGIRR